MSRSVHTSRAKFRKAAQFNYSSAEQRDSTLGKIADEILLKRDLKENAKRKKQSAKSGIRNTDRVRPLFGVASKSSPATSFGKRIARLHPETQAK